MSLSLIRIRNFFTQTTFRKEMTLVVVLKIFALLLLWWLFFSGPKVPNTFDLNFNVSSHSGY